MLLQELTVLTDLDFMIILVLLVIFTLFAAMIVIFVLGRELVKMQSSLKETGSMVASMFATINKRFDAYHDMDEEKVLLCPDCSHSIPEDSKFCKYCGVVVTRGHEEILA